MRLLLTRPDAGERDDDPLRAALAALGHTLLSAPLLTVVATGTRPSFKGAQAVIATSRNSLRCLSRDPLADEVIALPLFAVGPATASLGRGRGFRRVIEGTGGAQALEALIRAETSPAAGALVYLSGEQIAFDLTSALEAHGYAVRREILYRTEAARALPSDIAAAFRSGSVDGVVLMSPRTAMVYAALIGEANLVSQARQVPHFCLSEAVRRELASLGTVEAPVARLPNSQEMLALITRDAPDSP